MVRQYIALDVGEKRIGVAVADSQVRIAIPYDTIEVDGQEVARIQELLVSQKASKLIVGYPRNQSGLPTAQTRFVEAFVEQLGQIEAELVFQDESLTSVMAEERLKAQKKSYQKADIDAYAAAIILQDYLEEHHG